ncbi:MAG: TspO/MBR family protein [Candidatus Pacearchaeota archaeon]
MKVREKQAGLCDNICKLVISFVAVFITAILGNLFTRDAIKSAWYESIKPSITPPNWMFPIVWTMLFVLIALSLFFVWKNAKKKDYRHIFIAYGGNLILNALWSLFYFGMRMPQLAFAEIILLWITILMMINVAWKIDRKAAWMLVPYLLWVSFAAVLNYLSI